MTSRADRRYRTLPGLLAAAVERDPDGIAVDGPGRLTFADLGREVGEVAAGLRGLGIGPGDRIAIQAPNSATWIVAALATHSVGAALVPINTRYKGEETADIVGRSGVRLLFTVRDFLGEDYLARLRATGITLPIVVDLVGPTADGALALDAIRARAGELPRVDPDSPSDILYTSGTTGRPKGVICTHAQTLRTFGDWTAIVGLRADDRYLVVPPFFHCFGYKAGWVACLLAGATCVPNRCSTCRPSSAASSPTASPPCLDPPRSTRPCSTGRPRCAPRRSGSPSPVPPWSPSS